MKIILGIAIFLIYISAAMAGGNNASKLNATREVTTVKNSTYPSSEKLWRMQLTGGLSASFYQKDGTSRPGIDWAVQLTRGAERIPVIVRMYFLDGTSSGTKANTEYLSKLVLKRVNDLLNSGWDPKTFELSQSQDMAIYVSNP